MPSRIRRADLSDLHFLLELEQRVFLPERRESPASLRRSLSSPHQEVWIALDEGEVRAAAMILRLHRTAMRIYSLGVLPEAQGKGFGKTLLKMAESRAEALGLNRIFLEADRSDGRLSRLYQAHGFTQQRILPNYYGNGYDGVKLEKRLTTPAQSPTQ